MNNSNELGTRYTVENHSGWWTIRDTQSQDCWIGQFADQHRAASKAAELNTYGEDYRVPHPPVHPQGSFRARS